MINKNTNKTDIEMNQNTTNADNKKIIFSETFNEPLYNYIKVLAYKDTIVFGKEFNQSLSILPSNITKIFLGTKFQKSLIDIPSSIKSIIFANDSLFVGSFDYLHNELEELIIGDGYDQSINKLPNNLKILILGKKFNSKIKNFPNDLKYLYIGESYIDYLDNLPDNLETLVINGKYDATISYPTELKHFIIMKDSKFTMELKDLPSTLVYLSIQNNYTRQILNLPESLVCIELGDYYDGNIKKFPSKIKKIKLSKNFKYDFTHLPESLETIELSSNYEYIDFLIYKFPNVKILIN
jgi:hypothetical protein